MSYYAEVVIATLESSKEITLVRRICVGNFARCKDNFKVDDIVSYEADFPCEPSKRVSEDVK